MTTKKEIRDYFAKFGKKGGETRARNMTAEQRSQAARKAVEARWAQTKALVKEFSEGTKALLEKSEAASRAAKRSKPKTARQS